MNEERDTAPEESSESGSPGEQLPSLSRKELRRREQEAGNAPVEENEPVVESIPHIASDPVVEPDVGHQSVAPQETDTSSPNQSHQDGVLDDPDFAELAQLFPASREDIAPKKRRGAGKGCLAILIVFVLLLAGVGGVVWLNRDKIPAAIELVQEYLGIEPEIDYAGDGEGELLFTITEGDFGSDIARNLVVQDIVMTEKAFLEYIRSLDQEPIFFPGTYRVAQQMSSEAALNAITDQSNRVENSALIREGLSYHRAFEIISAATDIPITDFFTAAENLAAYGIPDEAPNIEGYLFPATYTFSPNATAEDIIRTLVDKMFSVLDSYGVAEEDRHSVLTMAGLIQREAGGFTEDFYKVSRVFHNRLEQGWKLQSDATVSYGTGNTGTVWTTAEDRADGSNLYNTYYHDGLPVGPISLPGELAIDAAIHPVDGPWMYFMAIDLRTGETAFAVTSSEHQANRNILAAWCQVPENQGYCGR